LHGRIADLLLASDGLGESVPGLEIAWHCVRAGRPDECTPYLLRGARQAMEHGAPFETEQALSSALVWLQSRYRHEAMLLLVEALQEQGRWTESRETLAAAQVSADEETREAAFVLAAKARCLEGTDDFEIADLKGSLIGIVANGRTLRSRTRAAQVCGTLIYNQTGSTTSVIQTARELHGYCAAIPMSELSIDEKSDLLLAKTSFVYLGHLQAESQELSAQLEAHRLDQQRLGVTNQAAALVENILGCLASTQGRYDECAPYFMRAVQMAERLGNDLLVSRAAANLAMVMGRIGRYEEQARWALVGLTRNGIGCEDTNRFKLAYYRAMGLAMLGKSMEALDCLSTEVARFSNDVPHWVKAVRQLLFADAKFVAGERREARRDAAAVFLGNAQPAFHSSYAGLIARWRAKLTETEHEAAECLRELTQLSDDLLQFDAVDQAEILSALVYVQRALGRESQTTRTRLTAALSALPHPVTTQLALLDLPT